MDFSIFAVHLLGISSIMNSCNAVATIFVARMSEVGFIQSSLFIWMVMLTSILLILAVPILAVGVTLLLLDRNMSTGILEAVSSGDELIFQHLF